MSEQICAVIITYFPELHSLRKLLQRLKGQVSQVVIIDNSEQSYSQDAFYDFETFVVVVHNHKNNGVAAAQNQGIIWAKNHFFTHVLLLDQDSLPETHMVRELVQVEKSRLSQGMPVAAVGPNILDRLTHIPEPLVQIKKLWIKKKYCDQLTTCRKVDCLISSGCLIRLAALPSIGFMDETFFIDLVDVEWCLRSKKKGFHLYVACLAELHHAIGTKQKIFRQKNITKHQPERLYYQYRNYLLLARRTKVSPLGWFSYHFLRHLLPRLLLFCLFVEPRMKNTKMIATGLYDGIMGINGKYKIGKL
jgi:rhamnosyltransferase